MANLIESDHVNFINDNKVLIVIDEKTKIIEGECDLYLEVDGNVCISIPGEHIRPFLRRLNAINVIALEANHTKIHTPVVKRKVGGLYHEPIPADFEVQPLKADENPPGKTTCGHCGLSWDDDKSTSLTPTPAARCPFEYFHIHD